MSLYMMILAGIGAGILLVSFFYTLSLFRSRGVVAEHDSKIPENVQEHPYLRNPVFLTYIIAAALVGLLIIIYAFSGPW
ncbi:hypothetical protein [Mesobacillus harenae]|uniref:hypothetical protein n=1 Tax=Mesobacillus harenae TaxID=2213203 RepID=UPI00158088BF|nr:hypothetical protein [Mesobacillus harenae]